MIVTDWAKCPDIDEGCVYRRIGFEVEVSLSAPDGQPNPIFFPALDGFPIDTSKLPSQSLPSIGIYGVTGWPKWFPIFNRRAHWFFRYPTSAK